MRTLPFSTSFRQAACMVMVLLLAACASGPRISTEADPRADFSRYRTFGFYAPLAVERDGYATPTTERMKAAVRAQLEARGYAYVPGKPDLWVNLNAYLERRTDISESPFVDHGYYYSYRARRYVAVPYWNQQTTVHRYTEGTVNVDLIDVERNSLVWEGIAVGRVANLEPADRDARIDATMAEIFARYPYRAGGVPAGVQQQ